MFHHFYSYIAYKYIQNNFKWYSHIFGANIVHYAASLAFMEPPLSTATLVETFLLTYFNGTSSMYMRRGSVHWCKITGSNCFIDAKLTWTRRAPSFKEPHHIGIEDPIMIIVQIQIYNCNDPLFMTKNFVFKNITLENMKKN